MADQTPPPLPTQDLASEGWCIEQDGSRVGPISLEDLRGRIAAGAVSLDTQVWAPGMAGWKRVRETALAPHVVAPPPLVANDIDNRFVFWIAVAPVLVSFIMRFVQIDAHDEQGVWIVSMLVVNTLFATLDEKRLKAAGYSVPLGWAIFFVPVYLFTRASRTKVGWGFAWGWIICIFLSMFIDPVR